MVKAVALNPSPFPQGEGMSEQHPRRRFKVN